VILMEQEKTGAMDILFIILTGDHFPGIYI
jgi:hypothetical protein